MDWDQDKTASRPTYVMDVDPRYMVERWGLGSWTAWFDGYRISPDDTSLGSRDEAQKFAEEHRNAPEQRIVRAQQLISLYGSRAGEGHRAWVIRSIGAVLAGREPDYSAPGTP
jgi:hypothetical protein